MIFVNYGGGNYWFFEHTPWNGIVRHPLLCFIPKHFTQISNLIIDLQKKKELIWPTISSVGLTVADLVMPWFVFIIGTSVALAFHAMRKRGVSRVQLLRKLTWRTVVLLLIGFCFLNYGPADGSLSWRWARIPGVLQRLGLTYFILALMETCFGITDLDKYQKSVPGLGNLTATINIVCFLHRGYLGPGGIGDDGKYPNCTGGAAGYIDKWLLGENHIYHYPTCKELYKTTQPFDPEGILGTLNSVVMAFFGLQ
ncbi:hypothetical protein lerEdw1_013905, partial [Lerista edwardsae]